jgi:DNA-binding MarR family transcriptional regulator
MESSELLECTIERFWDTVPPVWGRVRGKARSLATHDFSITLVQFHILRHIRKGVRTVCELAERQQISRPAVSQAVEVLVEKGLVTRKQDALDRRYVQLDLTDSGNSLLDSVFSKNHAWMAEKMKGLNSEELQSILIAMDVLKKTFDLAED